MQAIDEIILGNSLAVKEMKKLIEMVSKSNTTVLIQGETGTGKELVAEALHVASGRKGNNVSVNCAAIPSELLESELFGHEKGAFTGADRARPGRFEQADNGTIFLDEIETCPYHSSLNYCGFRKSKIQRWDQIKKLRSTSDWYVLRIKI